MLRIAFITASNGTKGHPERMMSFWDGNNNFTAIFVPCWWEMIMFEQKADGQKKPSLDCGLSVII